MNLETTHILDALGMAILHSLWQVFIAAGIVFFVYKITNSKQGQVRYIISYGALISCLLVFAYTFFEYLPTVESSETSTKQNDLLGLIGGLTGMYELPGGILSSETEQSYYEMITGKISAYSNWIGFFWIIGFLFYSVKYIVAFRLASQLRIAGVSEVEEYWQKRIRQLIAETKINGKTEMMYSKLVENPLTVGFFKPLILVPTGFLINLPPDQVEAVLLHEIAHIKRHDYVFNLIQTFVKTVFFYHPGVRYISNKIDTEREHLCDDFAVGKTDDPAALAKALGFLQLNSFNNQNSFAMNAIKRNHPFLARLKRLFGQEEQVEKINKGRVVLPILFLLVAVFATTGYTEATPEIEEEINIEKSYDEHEEFITQSDTVPAPKDSNVWVEKKEEQIIVTEKDEAGNERKLIKETLENGEERVTAFLNGERVEVDEDMLAMIPPPPPAPPAPPPPTEPNPELYKELSELAQVYAEKKAKGIEDEETLRKLEVLGKLAALESLKFSNDLDALKGLDALEAIGEFDDIIVLPPMPPMPPFPPSVMRIDIDSLPEGINEEELEKYIEAIEIEAERIEELAEEFEDKYAEKFEEMIEKQIELEEEWIERHKELSEEKMNQFREKREDAHSLFEDQHRLFEEQLHEQTKRLEEKTLEMQERFPELFKQGEFDFEFDDGHFEHIFERTGSDGHLEDLSEDDLKELRNDLREMLADDGLIKGKKKKAIIRIINEETYSVNGKRMSSEQWKKYHDFFHENNIPHDKGMEIRAYKNIFQIGREEGSAFRGVTVFFD